MNIGREIRRLRLAREMPAIQLAAKAGINRMNLCRLEKARNPNPCWQTVEKLLKALHVEIRLRPN